MVMVMVETQYLDLVESNPDKMWNSVAGVPESTERRLEEFPRPQQEGAMCTKVNPARPA